MCCSVLVQSCDHRCFSLQVSTTVRHNKLPNCQELPTGRLTTCRVSFNISRLFTVFISFQLWYVFLEMVSELLYLSFLSIYIVVCLFFVYLSTLLQKLRACSVE
jgi:hypothetical protein